MDSEAEWILAQVQAGVLPKDSEEVQALLTRSPELADELARVESEAARLEALAQDASDLFEQSAAQVRPKDLDLARSSALAADLGAKNQPPTSGSNGLPGPWLRRLSLLAAACLVAFFALRPGTDSGPKSLELGSTPGMQPTDMVESIDSFHVKRRLRPTDVLTLEVFAAQGQFLLRNELLGTGVWKLTESERESIPADTDLRWTFALRDAGGELLDTGEAFVRQTP